MANPTFNLSRFPFTPKGPVLQPLPPGALYAPTIPNHPTPLNGITLGAGNPQLVWQSNWAINYDVYIGLTPGSLVLVSAAQVTNFFQTVAQSSDQTTYYWQIVARNGVGTTTGPIWSFILSLNPDDLTDTNTNLQYDPHIVVTVDGSQIINRIYVVSSDAGLGSNGAMQGPVSPPSFGNSFHPGVVSSGGAMKNGNPFFFYGFTVVTAIGESNMGPVYEASLPYEGGPNAILVMISPIGDARILSINIYRTNNPTNTSTDPSLFRKIANVSNVARINASSNFIYNGATVSDGQIFFGSTVLAYLDNLIGENSSTLSTSPPPTVNNSGITSVIVENLASQATLAAQTGGDGIREELVVFPPVDTSQISASAQLTAFGNARLALFSNPIQTIKYTTYDSKSRAGKTVNINLTNPPIVATLRIQSVTIDEISRSTGLGPRYNVTASTLRFTLDDLLRRVLFSDSAIPSGSSGGGGSIGSGGAGPGIVSVPNTAPVYPDPSANQIAWFFPLAGAGSIGYSVAACTISEIGTNPVNGDDATRPWTSHTTAASANNTSGVNASGGFSGIEHTPYYKFIIKTGSVVSGNWIWVGISVSGSTIPATNCPTNTTFIGFRFSDQVGNVIVNDGVIANTAGINPSGGTVAATGKDKGWLCIVQNTNGSPSTAQQQFIASGVPVIASTIYTLEISISGTTVTFTINGTAVGALSTVMPAPAPAFTAFQPWKAGPIGLATSEAVAKTLSVGAVYMKH